VSRARRRSALAALLALGALTAGSAQEGAGALPTSAVAVFPSGATFTLEIAADAESRALGYMFRDVVTPDEGMLFLFEHDGQRSFWMKNCRVELDIVWLDAGFRVLEIAHDQPPCPEEGDCPSIMPMRRARHVLEVAAGRARAEGLAPGDAIQIISEPPLF
jgi:uncharacterized membrane protein (UPF0127 family)